VLVDWVCLGLMLVLVVDVFLGVWSRYVLQATFQWYDEVARLCFVWMVFLGAASAVRRGAHFRLHLLIDRLGPRLRRANDLVVGLLVVVFGGVLVAGGVAMAGGARAGLRLARAVHGVVLRCAPRGGALMILFSLPSLAPGPRPMILVCLVFLVLLAIGRARWR
jgi:TRAP-type C4-dicarboxylate transport system permease small subunit